MLATCALTMTAFFPDPVQALDNPLTVNMRGARSHLLEAAATIFGSGSNVLVDVTRYGVIANRVAVTLDTGTCSNPGSIAFQLSPFTKDGSITELPFSIKAVAARARSMIVHQNADVSSATFACGNVKR